MTVKIETDERASIIGATGSGKTVLCKYLLNYAGDRVLVIDPKHTFQHEGYKVGRKLPILNTDFKTVYRPNRGDDDKLVKLLSEAYKRGNVRIYVDELATTAQAFPKATRILEDIARTGRERHISLWSATQRPRHVPLSFFTESEVWFVFLLRDPRDRSHVRDVVGVEVMERIPMYHFWYSRPSMSNPVLLTLSLQDNKLMEVVDYGRETVR